MIKYLVLIAQQFIVYLIIITSLLVSTTLCASELLADRQELPVDDRISAVLKQNNLSFESIREIHQRLALQHDSFNAAERYLMLHIAAKIAKNDSAIEQGIELVNEALLLEEKLAVVQINTPEFANIHLLLASLYSANNQFQLSYDEKKKYLEKYNAYRKSLRKERLNKLNKKYETDLKLKENELLLSEQKLKALQLVEAKKEQQAQRRNIIILFVSAIVFAVLLVRQLRIRAILARLAKTDSLTGLLNRRTLFEQGETLFVSAKDEHAPLCTMMIDIDHFKAVNDQFGHDIGDQAILEVAKLGKETLRAKDVFARIGGEEFAVILPNTEIKQAKAIAERLREKVQQFSLLIRTDEKNLTISISIGVSQLNEETVEFDELLHLADEAMYKAKADGRNRVCF